MARRPPHDQNTWQLPHFRTSGESQGACMCTLPCCHDDGMCVCPSCNGIGHVGCPAAQRRDRLAAKER